MRLLRILIVAWIICCSTAHAGDFFVNNESGDDRFDGRDPDSLGGLRGPFRTIARALRAAQYGDEIFIENTKIPYRESLTLQAANHSGVAGRPFVIHGNNAILDGREAVPVEAWIRYKDDVFRFPVEKKAHHMLYVGKRPARRVYTEPASKRLSELEAREWCLFEGHLYFRTEPGRLPDHYELSHTVLPVGLTLYEVHDVVIEDLIVQGFQLDGVNAHDGVTSTRLIGLTCRGNGRSGISIGGASRVRIEACLVGDNGTAQVRTEGFSRTLILNSDLIDKPFAPALERDGGLVDVQKSVASRMGLQPVR